MSADKDDLYLAICDACSELGETSLEVVDLIAKRLRLRERRHGELSEHRSPHEWDNPGDLDTAICDALDILKRGTR